MNNKLLLKNLTKINESFITDDGLVKRYKKKYEANKIELNKSIDDTKKKLEAIKEIFNYYGNIIQDETSKDVDEDSIFLKIRFNEKDNLLDYFKKEMTSITKEIEKIRKISNKYVRSNTGKEFLKFDKEIK